MQNLRPSNIKVIFQRPSCGYPIAVALGFIAGTAPVARAASNAGTFSSERSHFLRLRERSRIGQKLFHGSKMATDFYLRTFHVRATRQTAPQNDSALAGRAFQFGEKVSIRFDSRYRIDFFDSIRFGNLINLPLVH